MLRHDERLAGVGFAITDRLGGVSRAPYDGLNLAEHVGDDPADVATNRHRLVGALGVEGIAWMNQVHGVEVAVVEGPDEPVTADALVTRVRGLALAVLVADCTPVLVADPAAGVVGAAHAGRRGLAGGVVPALLEAMSELGARSLMARVGPSICPRCYPVPAPMRAEVAGERPEAWSVTATGEPALDIAAGVVAQLTDGGAQLQWLPGCSAQEPDLYSYRAAGGVTGRYAGLAWLA